MTTREANHAPAIDLDHLRTHLVDLLTIPSIGGTAALVDVQEDEARACAEEGLAVD
ncbi:MAG: hypothetical protein ACKOE2_15160 [Actinomycetales bacterium]